MPVRILACVVVLIVLLFQSAGAAVVYEGFDYDGTAIEGLDGGTGWAGPWEDGDGDFTLLTNDDTSLDSDAFPFEPVGDHVSGSFAEAIRRMDKTLDLSQEGNYMYLSALVQKDDVSATTADDLQIRIYYDSINDPDTDPDGFRARFFIGSADHWGVQVGSDNTSIAAKGPDGAVQPGVTYFVVMKIKSGESLDEGWLKVFEPTDTVPTEEPLDAEWDLHDASANSGAILEFVYLRLGENAVGRMDEVRVGDTWADVTAPGGTGELVGDLNGDGLVGSADLDIVRGSWGQSVDAGCLSCGDPSGDGMVGSADLDIVRANWGNTAAASVPEPGTILLLVSALAALVVRRR